ncbi:glycosyltransferase [Planctomycetota bacterium]
MKRILLIADSKNLVKVFLTPISKLQKGFLRLGHDVRIFDYSGTLAQFSPLKSRTISALIYKSKVDQALAKYIRTYKPHIILLSFAKHLNADSIRSIRAEVPTATIIAMDFDAWPKLHTGRLDTAKEVDIVIATNDGEYLNEYCRIGVPLCAFMPNTCDPDTDKRYTVDPKWHSDLLWTGTSKHKAANPDPLREKLVERLAEMDNCMLYGCCGYRKIGGLDYFYAISGAKIGIHANADNSIRLYHSDRFTHYMACGTFVLAKRIPDTELLANDKKHVCYFDEIEEFFDLAKWYLSHEQHRKKIADSGMAWAHEQFNCKKIAGHILDLIEKGTYKANWT